MKHLALLAAFVIVACVPPQPSAFVSPLMQPVSPLQMVVSPLALPRMRYKYLLPVVHVAPVPTPTPTPPPVQPALRCGLNATADQMATLLVGAGWQKRTRMVCDYRLTFAAQWRATDMAKGNYFAHESSTGESPNEVIKRFGCRHGYGNGNTVESVVAGSPDPALSLGWLFASPSHRDHIAGESKFFRGQTRYGVGYAANPHVGYGHYFVILTANCD